MHLVKPVALIIAILFIILQDYRYRRLLWLARFGLKKVCIFNFFDMKQRPLADVKRFSTYTFFDQTKTTEK